MSGRITLAHGNGGRFMRALIAEVIDPALGAAAPDITVDAAPFDAAFAAGELVATTDGFTVQPLEFPGGDLGALAAHGVVNDLAVAGATPLALTLSAIVEEGVEFAQLRRLVARFGAAAGAAGVRVLAGDTKVAPHGQGAASISRWPGSDGCAAVVWGWRRSARATACWSAARSAITASR